MKILAVLFAVLVLGVVADEDKKHYKPKPIEPALHEEHYDAEGHHNAEFDAESVFGEDHEQFKNLDDEHVKEKLGEFLEKMDENKDEHISQEELQKWIVTSYKHIDRADTDKNFDENDLDHDGKLNWSEVMKYTYGYIPSELEKLVEEKNADALTISRAVVFDQKKFAAADADKDEELDKEEFFLFVHPANTQALSDVETSKTMSEFDKNKDGKIDFTEYLSESGDVAADDEEKHKETEHQNFKDYDMNQNSFLDFEEVRKWMVPSYESVAHHEVVHIFGETDKDKNGVLSHDEVLEQQDLFTGSHITREHDEL